MQQNLIGESPAFHAALDKVSKLATIERPVLIIGERGTGKELIAQRLHYLSRRWDKPLISLNCSALSDGLIDSELFGHEQGAFTNAKARHKGRFERAENGSLFLDELATTPLGVQEKLLRVIEYGHYERVGGHQPLYANVRLICATNADLPHMAQQGKFRADLLDRLAFDVIHLPPLRQRQADILLLAEHYAIKMCRELGLGYFVGFSAHAEQSLLDYAWPGNIRELKNVIERAVYQHGNKPQPIDQLVFDPFRAEFESQLTPVSAADSEISKQTDASSSNLNKVTSETTCSEAATNLSVNPSLPLTSTSALNLTLPLNYKQWQEQQDRLILTAALKQSQFNQRKAAQLLGLSYHQLRGMIRKYDLLNFNQDED